MTWGLRFTTFLTNTAVLIGYAVLLNWLQTTKFAHARNERLRVAYLIGITIGFLLLFHYASILQMAELGNRPGFGWNYIDFQIATVLYALLSTRERSVLISLVGVLLVWYWWLPNAPDWPLFFCVTLLLMGLTQAFGVPIGSRWWRYYPFCLVFAAPFLLINYESVHGIAAGWPWQLVTYGVICFVLWTVHYAFKNQRIRQATLLAEARHDELTHLRNFRVFSEDLQAAYERSQASGKPYALYTFDIDWFKQVNDRYGHIVGNQVLQGVAARLRTLTRELGYAGVKSYRTGGEEFSFILPEVVPSFERAQAISWAIHDELGKLTFTTDSGETFHVSISLGEERSDPTDQNYLDVYKRADHALYSAKRSGRDRVTVAGRTLSRESRAVPASDASVTGEATPADAH